MASEFIRQLQTVFQSSDDAVEQYRAEILVILGFVRSASVQEFIQEFSFDHEEALAPEVEDAKFIEISTISLLVLGKSTHYNENRRYYVERGNAILAALSSLRRILERLYPHQHGVRFVKLSHLAWAFRIFYQFLDLRSALTGIDSEGPNSLRNPSGNEECVDYKDIANSTDSKDRLNIAQQQLDEIEYTILGTRSSLSLSQINHVLGRFLLQEEFLLSRICGLRVSLPELINQYMKASKEAEIQFNPEPELSEFLYNMCTFEDVFDFVEMAQTYLCSGEQVANIAVSGSVLEWLENLALASCNLAKKANQPLSVEMTQMLRKDIHRYLINTNVISEPVMFAILLCFMFNSDIVWFSAEEVIKYLNEQLVEIETLWELEAGLEGEDFEEYGTQLINELKKESNDEKVRLFTEKRIQFKEELTSAELLEWFKMHFEGCCLDPKRMLSNVFNLIYTIYAFVQSEDESKIVSIREFAEAQSHDANVMLTERATSLEDQFSE